MKTKNLEDNKQWILNNSQEPITVYDYARQRDITLLPGQTVIITKAPETKQETKSTRKKQEKTKKYKEETEDKEIDLAVDINTSAE